MVVSSVNGRNVDHSKNPLNEEVMNNMEAERRESPRSSPSIPDDDTSFPAPNEMGEPAPGDEELPHVEISFPNQPIPGGEDPETPSFPNLPGFPGYDPNKS